MSSPAETPIIRNIGFSCRDAEALASFYKNRLGFKRRGAALFVEGGAYAELVGLPGSHLQLLQLQIGAEILELMQVLKPGPGLRPGRPIPADSRSCDLWFQHICLVVNDMAAAVAPIQAELNTGHLQPISSAPQTLPAWNKAAAGIQAYKFHDPEGHCLELLQFPPDKGEARWHRCGKVSNTGSPVLGMDHSAIAVADTRRSCAFYEELLGLRLAGDGINSGIEQDLLDGLEGTRVQITSHRCLRGPGIECLNYRQPTGGRSVPADQNASDTAHWQIRLAVNDLKTIAERVEIYGGTRLAGPLTLTDKQAELLGFHQALQIRDPDGHALQLVSAER